MALKIRAAGGQRDTQHQSEPWVRRTGRLRERGQALSSTDRASRALAQSAAGGRCTNTGAGQQGGPGNPPRAEAQLSWKQRVTHPPPSRPERPAEQVRGRGHAAEPPTPRRPPTTRGEQQRPSTPGMLTPSSLKYWD